jgi:hypothetical protein
MSTNVMVWGMMAAVLATGASADCDDAASQAQIAQRARQYGTPIEFLIADARRFGMQGVEMLADDAYTLPLALTIDGREMLIQQFAEMVYTACIDVMGDDDADEKGGEVLPDNRSGFLPRA